VIRKSENVYIETKFIYLKIYQILPDLCDIYGFKCLEGFVRNTAEILESES